MKTKQIEYHRNGVTGEPFFAVLFNDDGCDMFAAVFAEARRVAVVAVDPLSTADGVTFGVNSYRGDQFERFLRSEIAKIDDPESEFQKTWEAYNR
jgi:hypothetical protein